MLAKGRRHADQDGVAALQFVEVPGGLEAAALDGSRHALGADVLDVRLAAVQGVDLLRVEVQADDGEPGLVEHQGEG